MKLRPRLRRISRRGVRLIADFEGGKWRDGRFHAYRDPVGVWTIGYGHTHGVGPHTKPWTAARARRELRRELNLSYAPHVLALGLPLTQPMLDALVSFVYNVGPGALAPTTGIGRELRAHHWHKAADELLKWDRAGGRVLAGLSRRRQAERHLFLTGL